MTNHVYLLATPGTDDGISKMLGLHRSGTLWEGRFKSYVVEADDYLLVCQRYIELSPVRAGMVSTPEEYVWSSFQANGLGEPVKLWSAHSIYQQLGKTPKERLRAYRELFRGHPEPSTINQIRAR